MTERKVRSYLYVDPKSKPRLQKIRKDPKRFIMESWAHGEHGDAWRTGTEAQAAFAHMALYHLDELLWALRDGRDVYWCEGEKDCDAMRGRFDVAATSHWQGALGATKEQAAWFNRVKRLKVTEARSASPDQLQQVYIIADIDGAGAACALRRKALLNKVMDAAYYSKHLIPAMNVVILAPPHPHKDAADAILAGCGLTDFRRPDPLKLKRAAEKYLEQRAASNGHREDSDWLGFTKDWQPKQINGRRKSKRPTAKR